MSDGEDRSGTKLHLIRCGAKWWIDGDCTFRGWDMSLPYGPYDTKTEANADRLNIIRSLANFDTPGYWTSDSKMKNYVYKRIKLQNGTVHFKRVM